MNIEEKFKGKNVLTVDDSMTIRNYLRSVLTPMGAKVDGADTGQAGLDAAQSKHYDLILLDLLLPDMDGIQVLKMVRLENEVSAVVVLTGTGGIRSAIAALQQGADGYLEKQDMISSEQTAFFFSMATALERRMAMVEQKKLQAEIADKVEQLKISERKALEASLAKSTFLAGMSHELRTPLNAILGFVQLMQRDQSLNSEQLKYLSIIMNSGEHLLGLINDVLSLSKIEAGKITLTEQAFDLKRLLDTLEETFAMRVKNKNLSLKFDLDPQLPQYVRGDEGKLRQVLINLLGNAVKFTEVGGITLRIKSLGEKVSFEVADTGHGIAKDEMNKLFEPFMQTQSGQKSKEGTGLGLAISQNFVRLMGGEFNVTSELGKGTSFQFEARLSLADENDAQPERRKVKALATGQPDFRILVADDKWENRTPLVKLLTAVGFSVREASNGKEAVEIWMQWQPDLIWMDMRMSVMDGFAATKKIRSYELADARDAGGPEALVRHVPIIALTASAFEQDRDAILAIGCSDFVAKPFRENTIFEKMAKYLGVEYLYEDTRQKATQEMAVVSGGALLTPAALSTLPAELLTALNEALTMGDLEASRKAIDQIRMKNELIANELRKMIDTFQFEELQAIVEQV